MPKYTVIRYHTVVDEFYDVEGIDGEAAIQYIVEHPEIAPNDVKYRDPGEYGAEESEEEEEEIDLRADKNDDGPIVAVNRVLHHTVGTFCVPCCAGLRVHEKDKWYTQAQVDQMIFHPGYRVQCSKCHKVLSTETEKEGAQDE